MDNANYSSTEPLKEQLEELKERIQILHNTQDNLRKELEEADQTIAKLRERVKHWKRESVKQYVANFCAFLSARGEGIAASPADALDAKTIAGALFDFLGYLTTLPAQEAVTFSECHEASSAVEHLEKWAEKRSLSLDEADVLGWDTAKAEPTEVIVPCMTAEEVNALPEKVRDYIHQLATNADPSGMVRENMQLRDANNGLQIMYRKAAARASRRNI